jgi:hypothetical protein
VADVDTSKWSNEGTFTQVLIDRLRNMDAIAFVAVEDAPATRSEADYNFISNEVYVSFASQSHAERSRWLGVFPVTRQVTEKVMTIDRLGRVLSEAPEVGSPDYADEGMLQYLKTERIIPPYQTRGYKLVELVRVYEVGTVPRA